MASDLRLGLEERFNACLGIASQKVIGATELLLSLQTVELLEELPHQRVHARSASLGQVVGARVKASRNSNRELSHYDI